MNKKTIYSVVDLEATGTSAAEGDKIIQFSCTFVQDQRILDSFSTLINPQMTVPERITQLTGITNEMVKEAPTFEDVASLLYNMLQDTVFVAHNVNFDFPFLNHELRRMGHATLNIKAIDTVTMSQILLPMLPSYQLRRISSYFNIVHKHPHSASSDAYATADLLILLIDRLKRLPYDTLHGIIQIHPKLPQNTMEMFIDALRDARTHHHPLPSYLRIKRGLVLRRNHYSHHRRWNRTFYKYPVSKRQKCLLYNGQLKWQPKQAHVMNQIYLNYTKASRPSNRIYEVATGMGRKIAYTLPLAYLSHNKRQTVIISTSSKLLRKQLCDQTIPTLNDLLPFNINRLLIKDNQNYIDLNRFFNTLRVHERSNQTQLVKAMVLVWLTMTTSGDLNELHINPRTPYLNEIRHYQDHTRRRHNPFYYQDFIRQHQLAARHVNFVIVSQTYLCHHAKELSRLSRRPYLVIDEASQLPKAALSQYRFKLNLNLINIAIRRIMGDLYRTHHQNLHQILPNRFSIKRRLKRLNNSLVKLNQVYQKITHHFSTTFLQPHLLMSYGKQMIALAPVKKLQKFFNDENPKFQTLNHEINNVRKTTNYFKSLSRTKRYQRINRLEMDNYYHHVSVLTSVKDLLSTLINQIQTTPKNCVFEVVTNEPHNIACCKLIGGLIDIGNHLQNDLYQYYQPAIFTDHALITSGSNLAESKLKLLPNNTRQESDLNRISSAKPVVDVYQTDDPLKQSDQYCQTLANFLVDIIEKHPQRLLVGFSSRSLMYQTFGTLTSGELDVPVYAHGINGSRKRILKQLTNAQTAIVFADLSWFHALNLAYPKGFGSLIIADMPLEFNGTIYQRAKARQIKRSHQNFVKRVQLPNVILNVKRALNYVHDHHDRLVIFDGRILNSKYLGSIKASLPAGVTINQRKVEIHG